MKAERRAIAGGILRDVAALAGAGLVGYGAWLAWAPAGFMAGGVLLLAAAVLGSLRSA